MRKLYFVILLSFIGLTANSQVTGTVTDAETGDPLVAATVRVVDSSVGAVTDFEGNFEIDAEIGQSLLISYVGYEPETVLLTSSTVNVSLNLDAGALNEVVVIGYGTEQSKDLTSAITTIRSEELEKTPTGQTMQALQGKVAGLQVISSGAPGGEPTVRLRGFGSYAGGNGAPLYVVDGMFFNNIDFINTSDIETVTVLKDASASAIYGVRAANGVVIITTKSADIDQPTRVTLDSYYGVQVATDVLQMANAEQYVQMVSDLNPATSPDFQFVQEAMQRYGRSRVNPNVPDVNTDWYDQVIRNAPVQNHNINISGGGANAGYSLGGSWFEQDGILNMDNSFTRYNLRAKVDFQAYDWLKIGGNAILSNAERQGFEASAWRTAYFAVPILPVNDNNLEGSFPDNFSSAQSLGYRGGQNPFPLLEYNDNDEKLKKQLTNFYAEVDLLPEDKLKFKTAFNQNTNSLDLRLIDLPFFYSNGSQRNVAGIGRTWTNIDNRIFDNTLTFKTDFNDLHDLTILGGASYRDEQFSSLRARAEDFPVNQEQAWYIDQAENIIEDGVVDNGGRQTGQSYFGRASYKFDDKYILYGTFRADGSSKYQETWGYFPAVGAAWVVSDEDFFESGKIDFIKLRGGWGRLGNDNIAASVGENTVSFTETVFNNQRYTGYNPSVGFDSLVWEVVEETNIGITMDALSNRLTLEADYFIRDTENAAIPVLQPFIGTSVRKPVGEIRNEGLDFMAAWSDDVNDKFSYNIGGNFGTLKNEVLDLFGQEFLDAGSAEFRQRTYVGESLFAFYGWQTDGVYQNQSEIDNDPIAVANGLVPGDYRFTDLDGDGDLDGEDRTILGSFLPDLTYGFNIGATYGDLSLSTNFYGQSGNQILNRKRGEYIFTNDTNIDADLATNLWRGEGTSNIYPSADGLRRGWNQRMSNYYVEDGDFFRVQNVNLAYRVNGKKYFGDKFPDATIKATADRPLTFFNYNGFNPEVANGVDTQTYPVPATYTVGLNVNF